MSLARASRCPGLLLAVAACAETPAPARPAPPESHAIAVAAPAAARATLDEPALLVHVDACKEQVVSASVRQVITEERYATEWPGGLPTEAMLAARGARAYVVVPTIEAVEVARAGHRATIDCRIQIRVSPWRGTDGGEHWEATTAARAHGRARVETSAREPAIAAGARDCLREVAQQVTANRVVPFLRGVAARAEVAAR